MFSAKFLSLPIIFNKGVSNNIPIFFEFFILSKYFLLNLTGGLKLKFTWFIKLDIFFSLNTFEISNISQASLKYGSKSDLLIGQLSKSLSWRFLHHPDQCWEVPPKHLSLEAFNSKYGSPTTSPI